MEVGGVEACCNVLRRHVKTPSACQNACGALGRLLTTPQSVDRVCACGAVQLTVACLQTSPRGLDLIDEAAFLLTALVGRMVFKFELCGIVLFILLVLIVYHFAIFMVVLCLIAV